ncbi:MAG: hypothetical protein GY820_17330 [Gammaproteobacteria bacterium]|nr:hypothetical protein [Gammaproteobacteria bacterium]
MDYYSNLIVDGVITKGFIGGYKNDQDAMDRANDICRYHWDEEFIEEATFEVIDGNGNKVGSLRWSSDSPLIKCKLYG